MATKYPFVLYILRPDYVFQQEYYRTDVIAARVLRSHGNATNSAETFRPSNVANAASSDLQQRSA